MKWAKSLRNRSSASWSSVSSSRLRSTSKNRLSISLVSKYKWPTAWLTGDLKRLGVNICCIQNTHLIPSDHKGVLSWWFLLLAYFGKRSRSYSSLSCSLDAMFTCLHRSSRHIVCAGCCHKGESIPIHWNLLRTWKSPSKCLQRKTLISLHMQSKFCLLVMMQSFKKNVIIFLINNI